MNEHGILGVIILKKMNSNLSKIWTWTSTSGTGLGFRWPESLVMILVIVEALSEEPEEKYCEENIQVLHK